MRRIDYIRQTVAVPRHGLERGNNPLAAEFSITAMVELRQVLQKYRGRKTKDVLRLTDIANEAGIDRESLREFVEDRRAFGISVLRRLSRVVAQAEFGLLVKRGNAVLRVDEPTRKPDHIFRICFTGDGKPTITRGEQSQAPKTLPRLFSSLSLPGR